MTIKYLRQFASLLDLEEEKLQSLPQSLRALLKLTISSMAYLFAYMSVSARSLLINLCGRISIGQSRGLLLQMVTTA